MGDRIIVYRRDGCHFCRSLERRLRDADVDYDRRDIRDDPEAAAFVRSVNAGNETVPTVVLTDGRVQVNPKPSVLLRELGVVAPPSRWNPFRGR